MSAGGFFSCKTSPYKMNEENPIEKQGIISILTSDFNSCHKILPSQDKISPNSSIRRTLSADMSSPKWLQNNGFPLKKVQSSHQLETLGEEFKHHNNDDHDQDKGPALEDIWSSIQSDKRSWGSILSPSKNGSGSGSSQLPPPYVHPLAKKRSSSLSEKSLEICTESLGSETGSDGFSYSSSEPEDSDKEHEHEDGEEKEKEKLKEQQEDVCEMKRCSFGNASEMSNCKYTGNGNGNVRGLTSKRSMVPSGRLSFPPPLPSLTNRDDGSNLHICSHRQDGRLVVEAVSVPSQNCFRAQRQHGRLVLTLIDNNDDQGDDHNAAEEVKEENTDKSSKETIKNQNSYQIQTLTMVSKHLLNKSQWPQNYNTTLIKTLNNQEDEEKEEESLSEVTLALSTSTVVALNTYEYYWRRDTCPAPVVAATTVAVLNPLAGHQGNNPHALQVVKDTRKNNQPFFFAAHNSKEVALAQQEVVLVKGARRRGTTSTEEKGEYLVPFMLRGCKDHKKSFLFLDPYCIATS